MNDQRLVILLLLIAYIFSPMVFSWVLDPQGAWYRPYLLWIVVIVIAYSLQAHKRKRHDV